MLWIALIIRLCSWAEAIKKLPRFIRALIARKNFIAVCVTFMIFDSIHNDFINGKGESQWLERDKRFTEKFRGISKDTAYSAFKIRIGKPEERG